MGIDFAYIKRERLPIGTRPHWSYSGFSHFRTRLAEAVGIELDQMDGFKADGREWTEFASDPIVKLLNHSDCDGQLTCEECRAIAPRLRELIAKWSDDDYDKDHASKLASMMEQCAANEWDLEFC
jgi:hypothetical protein